MDNEPQTIAEIEAQKLYKQHFEKPVFENPNGGLKGLESPPPQTPNPAALGPGPGPSAEQLSYLIPPADPGAIGFSPAFGFNDLVEIWYAGMPDTPLYDWQAEELYRASGYVTGKPSGPRVHYTAKDPYLAAYPCANGSGKDRIVLSATAVGLPLLYTDMFVVATSSSYEQLKHQTENHIKRLIAGLSKRFGFPIYNSVEFYHSCAARGSEIKLFATDEAGRAEGWHPMTETGRLAILVNECKSIPQVLFTALDRCHGFTHRLEISSPGGRMGMFYENTRRAIAYPEILIPGKYFTRKVDFTQCPHIEQAAFERAVETHGLDSHLVQTSFLANFFENESDVVIPLGLVLDCENVEPAGDDIGIGLDAAIGGDETVLKVRKGNRQIDSFAFIEPQLTVAAQRIDLRLDPYRYEDYTFLADDNGVGKELVNQLTAKGWNIRRTYAQSAAFDTKQYANLGAQIYWHTRNLFQSRKIVKPKDDKTILQLTTRRCLPSEGLGKYKLDSKKRIKEIGGSSPDHADAFVLCFFSFKNPGPSRPGQTRPDLEPLFSSEDILRRQRTFSLTTSSPTNQSTPTCLIL